MTDAFVSRFWNRVDKRDFNDCWPWSASKNAKGYGMFGITKSIGKYRYCLAHRVAFCLNNDRKIQSLSSNEIIRHACDNPSCCNPSHLLIGSRQDNIDDMVRRGRSTRGERNAAAKLTESDVFIIRNRLNNGDVQQRIANDMGVSQQTVSDIKTGKLWKQ